MERGNPLTRFMQILRITGNVKPLPFLLESALNADRLSILGCFFLSSNPARLIAS